jgi:hypothetical protein
MAQGRQDTITFCEQVSLELCFILALYLSSSSTSLVANDDVSVREFRADSFLTPPGVQCNLNFGILPTRV